MPVDLYLCDGGPGQEQSCRNDPKKGLDRVEHWSWAMDLVFEHCMIAASLTPINGSKTA
jgi:hypothetical protein